MTKDISDIFK